MLPASASPVIGLSPFGGFTLGGFGAIASTVALVSGEVFPAPSVAVTLSSSPSFKPGFGKVHLPSDPTIVVSVLPSGYVTLTVLPGSAVPVIGSLAFGGLTTGAFGAVVSLSGVESLLSCDAIAIPAATAGIASQAQGFIESALNSNGSILSIVVNVIFSSDTPLASINCAHFN